MEFCLHYTRDDTRLCGRHSQPFFLVGLDMILFPSSSSSRNGLSTLGRIKKNSSCLITKHGMDKELLHLCKAVFFLTCTTVREQFYCWIHGFDQMARNAYIKFHPVYSQSYNADTLISTHQDVSRFKSRSIETYSLQV